MSLTIEKLDCENYEDRLKCHENECGNEYDESDKEYQDPLSGIKLGKTVVQTKDGDPTHTHCYNDDPDDHGLRIWVVESNGTCPLSRRAFGPPYPTDEWNAEPKTEPEHLNPFIAAMDSDDVASFRTLLSAPFTPETQIDANNGICHAVIQGKLEFFRIMLADQRIDPEPCLFWAAEFGQPDIMELLLLDNRVINPSDPECQNCNWAIGIAAFMCQPDVVQILMANERVNPGCMDNLAIRKAVEASDCDSPDEIQKYENIVRMLLADKRVDPSAQDNYCIRVAVQHGQTGIVQMLLEDKRVNPSTDKNACIRMAAERGLYDIVELLLKNERVDITAGGHYAIRSAIHNKTYMPTGVQSFPAPNYDGTVELLKQKYESDNKQDNPILCIIS